MINFFRIILLYFFSIACAYAEVTIPLRDPFLQSTVEAMSTASNTQSDSKLHSLWIPVYFASAKNVSTFLSKKSSDILSSQGKINYDKRSNQIWLQDDVKHIVKIRAMIHHLDQSGPQFLIKAKIITIDREYQKKLGFLFHTDNQITNPMTTLTMDEPDNNTNDDQFTVNIAKLSGNNVLNLQISALEQEGHASLISSPSLMTLENQPAVIESGAEVPYQKSTSSGATSVSFKKAVLCLKVTPQLLPNRHILLHISLNQDKVSALTVKGVPAIETQQITTQVVVKDHQTIVLGGILEKSRAKQQKGIPVMNKLPLIGGLFQHHSNLTKQEVLLIFITPSMMKTL